MAQIAYNPKFQAFDSAGDPLSGGKLYTYSAGTSTPKTTWADSGEVTPNANPIVLDSRGEATIYGSGSYKFVLKTSADATLWTVDNIAISGSVTTADIQDLAVTTAKLAANVLTADATGRGKMQDGFVTSAKLDTAGLALPNPSTATTQTAGDNTTKVATTAFVRGDRKVRQFKYAEFTSQISGSPYQILPDGSIPQSSEGYEFFAESFTPTESDSIVVVEVVAQVSSSDNRPVVGIWKDAVADALSVARGMNNDTDYTVSVVCDYKEVSGSTSARTYRAKAAAQGVAGGNVVCINRGQTTANPFGTGLVKSTMKITEYAP